LYFSSSENNWTNLRKKISKASSKEKHKWHTTKQTVTPNFKVIFLIVKEGYISLVSNISIGGLDQNENAGKNIFYHYNSAKLTKKN